MTDHERYQQLQTQMRQMIREGRYNYLTFQDLWEESNAILNRHGGFPPMPSNEDIDDENQILAETGVEMGVR